MPANNNTAPDTQPSDLPIFLWDPEILLAAKSTPTAFEPAINRLRHAADKALNFAPVSVMIKDAVPPSGDKHDYMSVGPYWWPDPDKPNGLPYIRRDGEINPDYNNYDNVHLKTMCNNVGTLALASFLFENEAYTKHAATLLRVWFLDDATKMNPHLEYGQAVPGLSKGRPFGIIETSGSFPSLVDALGILEMSDAWTKQDAQGMRTWMSAYLTWLQESEIGKAESQTTNNHGTHYDAQAIALALYTDQLEIVKSIVQQIPEKRINAHIEPDGSQPNELARTKSRNYTLMNLLGLIKLATLSKQVETDLWHYTSADGRGIRKAIDWFIPYIQDEKKWQWEQIKHFNTSQYATLFWYASVAYQDPNYKNLFHSLASEKHASDRMNLTWPQP